MRIFSLLLIFNALLTLSVYSQDSKIETFDDNVLNNWTKDASYILTEVNQELKVDVDKPTGYQSFNYYFSATPLDLSESPYVKIKIKSSSALTVRIDLRDAANRVTNQQEVKRSVPGNDEYQEFTYDFTGMFYQLYPENQQGPVNASRITALVIMVNAGGDFTGTIYIDDIKIGAATGITPPPTAFMLNQLGFYPNEAKIAICLDTTATNFSIVNTETDETVYSRALGTTEYWPHSQDSVRKADFSSFNTPGTYKLYNSKTGFSHEFEIKEEVHFDVMKAILKSYYYQRASMDLEEEYAGIYARDAGHPDQTVYVHSTAATSAKPENTVISTPGGWYDAGDYGKYIVNSGISTYQIVALYEHYPDYYDTLTLNIPESNNNIPDILDEALYNIRWMLTMQDKDDGGVFSKTTAERHDNTVMPANANLTRYVFAKSSPATLDFAAVMAQGYRVFRNFNTELPGLADSLITAAEYAYSWAEQNPDSMFTNPEGVGSGEYGDWQDDDEFLWARVELLLATGNDKYYKSSDLNISFNTPGWQDVKSLALISLVQNKDLPENRYNFGVVQTKLNSVTSPLVNTYRTSAYGVPMGTNRYNFVWGSNAVAGNQGVLLLQQYKVTEDPVYFEAALANLDYLLGRNATNFSFVTGYGDNTPMNIHHRPSQADGIVNPVPGLVSGGPHPGEKEDCDDYPSILAGEAFVDSYCSYSTNENAINYSSSVVYLAGAIEALKKGGFRAPTGIDQKINITTPKNAFLFPNPASDIISIRFMESGKTTIELCDLAGVSVLTKDLNTSVGESLSLDVSGLKTGMYLVKINIEGISSTEKIIIQ